MIIPFEHESDYDYFFYVKCDSCDLKYQFDFINNQDEIKCPKCGTKEVLPKNKSADWTRRRMLVNNSHIGFLNYYASIKNKTMSLTKKTLVASNISMVTLLMFIPIVIKFQNETIFCIALFIFTFSVFWLWSALAGNKNGGIDEIDHFIFEILKYNLSFFIEENFKVKLDSSGFKCKVSLFAFNGPDYLTLFDRYTNSVVSKEIKAQFKCVSLEKHIVNAYYSNDDPVFSHRHKDVQIIA